MGERPGKHLSHRSFLFTEMISKTFTEAVHRVFVDVRRRQLLSLFKVTLVMRNPDNCVIKSWYRPLPGRTVGDSGELTAEYCKETIVMTNIPEMVTPLCVLENNGSGLEVNQGAVEVISRITCPLVVVAIAGPYRTGKSYLMNRLMGQNNGFPMGNTIQAHTKGIWVWCRPHPLESNKCLLLLDTEGLEDVEKGSSINDNWIFALTTLLSSTLVYNNLATLQNDAIDKLQYPFHLRCVLETLFKSLSVVCKLLSSGESKKISDYNLPRECIRKYFRSRKCFVFDRPVGDKRLLRKLESLKEEQLDEDFLRQSQNFVDYIFTNSPTKSFYGKTLNGSSLCGVLQRYVDTINSGQVPCLENAFTAMAETENQKAVDEALGLYVESRGSVPLPKETVRELSEIHSNLEKKAVEAFLQKSFHDKDNQYQARLKHKLDSEYNTFSKMNDEASKTRCADVLKKVGADLKRKLSEGEYLKPGGFQEYEKDKSRMLQDYQREPAKGIKAQEFLQTYVETLTTDGKKILRLDKTMSENEKKMAENREAAQRAEQKLRAAEEEKIKVEQLMADQEKSQKEHVEQFEKKMKEEIEQLQKEYDLALNQKIQEQKRLMEEGFHQKARGMTDEIEKLKGQIKKNGKKELILRTVGQLSEALISGGMGVLASRVGRPKLTLFD